MGGAVTTRFGCEANTMTEEDIVAMVMPSYYTREPITPKELEAARNAWKMITENNSPHFNEMTEKIGEECRFETCLDLFHTAMFEKMMELNAESSARDEFDPPKNGVITQFVPFMTNLLPKIEDGLYWDTTLIKLAQRHCHMGITAIEYGILGEILLHAIKQSIGAEAYNRATRHGWKKIWSQVLGVVIPVAVRYELDLENILLHNAAPSVEFASTAKEMSPTAQKISNEGLTGVRRAALMLGATFRNAT